MSPLRVAGLVLAAVAVGAAVGLLVLTRGGGEATFAPALRGDVVDVRAAVTPRTHLFGEPVTAELDLVFDRRVVDADTIRVRSEFPPYRVVDGPDVSRSDSGQLARIRYRWVLECVAQDCLPQGASTRFDFVLGRLDFRIIDQGRGAQPFEWPSVEATSRVGAFDVEQAQWRANTERLTAVTYRLSPGILGSALLGGAVLLLVAAGALVWQLLPRGVPDELAEEEARRVSAIDRALELALESSANGATTEQRKALERLARELGAEGLDDLTHRARRLAWSPRPPRHGEIEALAVDVRRATESDDL